MSHQVSLKAVFFDSATHELPSDEEMEDLQLNLSLLNHKSDRSEGECLHTISEDLK